MNQCDRRCTANGFCSYDIWGFFYRRRFSHAQHEGLGMRGCSLGIFKCFPHEKSWWLSQPSPVMRYASSGFIALVLQQSRFPRVCQLLLRNIHHQALAPKVLDRFCLHYSAGWRVLTESRKKIRHEEREARQTHRCLVSVKFGISNILDVNAQQTELQVARKK